MIAINGKEYKLCLFDTNALSEFLKEPKKWILYFDRKLSISHTIICYSVFTLSELWHRKDLFNKYIEVFSTFPSAILDGYESIFQKEVENYNFLKKLSPIIVFPFKLTGNKRSPQEKLRYVIDESDFVQKTKVWREKREFVLKGILELRKHYPSKKGKYTKKEIEDFNLIASMHQIGIRNNKFAHSILDTGKAIDLFQFPSIVSTSYVVFYKFYTDNRSPILSDVFDIIISALLPYVDIVITEGNLCEIIKKIQKRHSFLMNLTYIPIKQIQSED